MSASLSETEKLANSCREVAAMLFDMLASEDDGGRSIERHAAELLELAAPELLHLAEKVRRLEDEPSLLRDYRKEKEIEAVMKEKGRG